MSTARVRGVMACYQVGVDVVGGYVGLYQDRLEPVFCHGEYRGDIGVGRHDYLVAVLHYAHLLVGTQNECKGVKSVAATYAVSCSDETGELFAERLVLCSLQIPSVVYNALHGFAYLAAVLRCNTL